MDAARNVRKACHHADSRPALRIGVYAIYLTAPPHAQAWTQVQTRRPSRLQPHLMGPVYRHAVNWLQVLGTTEPPHIDQGVRHQFHPVVALLDVLETEQQPCEFVLPRKRPLDALP